MAEDTDLRFSGTHSYAIDTKGRLTLPKHWRVKIEGYADWKVAPDSRGFCMRILDSAFMRVVLDRIREKVPNESHRRFYMNQFLHGVEDVTLDKEGRVLVPQKFRERFQLDSEVLLCGSGDHIQVWNPARHAASLPPEANMPTLHDITGA